MIFTRKTRSLFGRSISTLAELYNKCTESGHSTFISLPEGQKHEDVRLLFEAENLARRNEWNVGDIAEVFDYAFAESQFKDSARLAEPNAQQMKLYSRLRDDQYAGHPAITCWQMGVGINTADESGKTLLHLVLERRHYHLCSMLLDSGAEADIATPNGTSPLLIAAENGAPAKIIQALLDRGADINRVCVGGDTALFVTIRRHFNLFKMGEPHLLFASELQSRTVELLLQQGAEIELPFSNHAVTALDLAAATGSHAVVLMLLQAGADVNRQNKAGETALMHAAFAINVCKDSCIQTVQLLLEHGADPELKNVAGNTISQLIHNTITELSESKSDEKQSLQDLVTLLQSPPSPKEQMPEAAGPKDEPVGASQKMNDSLRTMLESFQWPDSIYELQQIAPSLLLQFGKAAAVQLLQHGLPSHSLLCTTSDMHAQAELVDFALSNSNIQEIDSPFHNLFSGDVPLTIVTKSSTVEVLRMLLHAGANPDTRNARWGHTALWTAAENGNLSQVQCLADSGCDLELAKIKPLENRPLHIASQNGHTDCCLALLRAGAVLHKPNRHGTSGFCLAIFGEHADTAAALAKYGSLEPHKLQQRKSASGRLHQFDTGKGKRKEASQQMLELVTHASNASMTELVISRTAGDSSVPCAHEAASALMSNWNGITTVAVLYEGMQMQLQGLESRPDLNGAAVTVTSSCAHRGRWKVQVDQTGDEISVLAKNLKDNDNARFAVQMRSRMTIKARTVLALRYKTLLNFRRTCLNLAYCCNLGTLTKLRKMQQARFCFVSCISRVVPSNFWASLLQHCLKLWKQFNICSGARSMARQLRGYIVPSVWKITARTCRIWIAVIGFVQLA
jgi:ankyrin repeat protein